MSDRLITAPASKVSGADFLSAITGRPRKTAAEKARDGEIAQAWIERDQMRREPGETWGQFADRANTIYAARLREIEARHAEALTETKGDPFLRRNA